MRYPHLAQVVQVGADPDGGLLVLVQSHLSRHSDTIARHPLAVAVGVAVGRLDRLTPVPHHRKVCLLQPVHLGRHVHQVYPGIEPAEQAVRRIQEPERFLVPAHHLIEKRQLPVGLGLAQDRAGAHRHLDSRAQTGFGERVAPRLPVHSADHLVRISLVELGAELVEDAQCRLGVLASLIVPLAGEVYLGVVQQAEALKMDVSDPLGDLEALPEVAVGVVPQLAVGADHAEVMIGDGAAPVISGALESLQRSLVVTRGPGPASPECLRGYRDSVRYAPAARRWLRPAREPDKTSPGQPLSHRSRNRILPAH